MLSIPLASSAKFAHSHTNAVFKSLSHFSTLSKHGKFPSVSQNQFTQQKSSVLKPHLSRAFTTSYNASNFINKNTLLSSILQPSSDNNNNTSSSNSPYAALLATATAFGILLTINEAQNDASTTTNSSTELNFDGLSFAPPVTPNSSVSKELSLKPSTPVKAPPRFDKVHEESMILTSVPVESGLTLRTVLPIVHLQSNEKSVLLMPQLRYGNEGTDAFAQLITSLGHRHHLKAVLDSKLNTSGEYRFRADNGIGINPSWHFSKEMGETLSLSMDWKQRDAVSELVLLHGGAQWSLSHMQALSSKLSVGLQWQFVPLQMSMMGYCLRYASDLNKLALTYTGTHMGPVWQASYVRKVWDSHTSPETEWEEDEFPDEAKMRRRAQHELNKQMAPPQTLSVGTTLQVAPDGKAVAAAGLLLSTVTYRYQASFDTTMGVKMAVETQFLPGVTLGLVGELKHDGTNENKVGVSLGIGL